LIKIACADHVETRRLQCLGDQPGIIRRSVECPRLISRIADHKRDALFGMGRAGSKPERWHQREQKDDRFQKPRHTERRWKSGNTDQAITMALNGI
jgi:hypothetical protein